MPTITLQNGKEITLNNAALDLLSYGRKYEGVLCPVCGKEKNAKELICENCMFIFKQDGNIHLILSSIKAEIGIRNIGVWQFLTSKNIPNSQKKQNGEDEDLRKKYLPGFIHPHKKTHLAKKILRPTWQEKRIEVIPGVFAYERILKIMAFECWENNIQCPICKNKKNTQEWICKKCLKHFGIEVMEKIKKEIYLLNPKRKSILLKDDRGVKKQEEVKMALQEERVKIWNGFFANRFILIDMAFDNLANEFCPICEGKKTFGNILCQKCNYYFGRDGIMAVKMKLFDLNPAKFQNFKTEIENFLNFKKQLQTTRIIRGKKKEKITKISPANFTESEKEVVVKLSENNSTQPSKIEICDGVFADKAILETIAFEHWTKAVQCPICKNEKKTYQWICEECLEKFGNKAKFGIKAQIFFINPEKIDTITRKKTRGYFQEITREKTMSLISFLKTTQPTPASTPLISVPEEMKNLRENPHFARSFLTFLLEKNSQWKKEQEKKGFLTEDKLFLKKIGFNIASLHYFKKNPIKAGMSIKKAKEISENLGITLEKALEEGASYLEN